MHASSPRLLFALAIVLASFGAGGGSASAEVAVRYDETREASPLVFRSVSERNALYREIASVLKRLGDRDLPPGRKLTVDLVDMRPAGEFQPWRPTADKVRVPTGVTPPAITLSYALTERGRTILKGQERITDLNYLSNVSARTSLSSFPYEQDLIRDWFRDRVVRLKPQPR